MTEHSVVSEISRTVHVSEGEVCHAFGDVSYYDGDEQKPPYCDTYVVSRTVLERLLEAAAVGLRHLATTDRPPKKGDR